MKTVILLLAILLIVLAILLGPSALAYVNSQGPLPGGVTLAGMTPTGANLEEVARNLHAAFQEPVAVNYDERLIILRPADVDFQVDVNAMVADAVPYGSGLGYWRPFLGQVFDRPTAPVEGPQERTNEPNRLARRTARQWHRCLAILGRTRRGNSPSRAVRRCSSDMSASSCMPRQMPISGCPLRACSGHCVRPPGPPAARRQAATLRRSSGGGSPR